MQEAREQNISQDRQLPKSEHHLGKKLLIIALLFIIVRSLVIVAYSGTYYYYGMVSNQFAIAEAAYNGHWFSKDSKLAGYASAKANEENRYIPIEEWKHFPKSGVYTTFPAQDLPGFAYIIAFTSKLFADELTTKYAFFLQVMMEMISILLLVYCVYLILGVNVAFIFGLLYIFAYPFIWPIASQPMRDIFVMGVYATYITAFFMFMRKNDNRSYLIIFTLVAISSLLLWIRPSGYGIYFLVTPLIFFVRNKSLKSRIGFALVTVLLPMLIFSLPYKDFNIRHYGVANTNVMGRGLWEGMGIIKDNPYGFVLDDGALVPWCESQGHKVAYSSLEMNKLLGAYAIMIIKEDPAFYVKTVFVRCLEISRMPIYTHLPKVINSLSYSESGLSLSEYAKRYPNQFVLKVLEKAFNYFFPLTYFYMGLALAILMFIRLRHIRLEMAVFTVPLLYTLATLVPIHFEQRFLIAGGAWTLIVSFAWYVDSLLNKVRGSKIEYAE